MGMYSSFKLVAIIDKPYREYFSKLLSTEEDYINFLYSSGGFFNVEKEYSKDTGTLVCGSSLKDYGHFDECNGSEVEFCINKAILPFGKIIVYYSHLDDLHGDCTCDPTNSYNEADRLNERKEFISVSSLIDPKVNKIKKLLKKDIESILERYIDYNFDLSELKRSLENL
jgi:hypothetical protein